MPGSTKTPIEIAVDITIRLGFLLILIFWCLNILLPFIMPVLWGVIISVSLYPLFLKVKSWFGNKGKLAATVITLFFLGFIIVPSYVFFESMADGIIDIGKSIESGELIIPEPDKKVADWPVVGKSIYGIWDLSHKNLEAALEKYQPQIIDAGKWLLSSMVGTGVGILQFLLSVIIAGVLLTTAESSGKVFRAFFNKLVGEKGGEFAQISEMTVRNVTKGILGVAVIQAALVGLGFILAGIPYAGLWALIVLILAIIQLPPLIVVIPVIIYMFSTMETVPATLWTIYLLLAGGSDNILKPILLGKGAPVPMLVIFLGAIGGFILSGFIGLFTGAIVLSLGYKLLIAWMEEDSVEATKSK